MLHFEALDPVSCRDDSDARSTHYPVRTLRGPNVRNRLRDAITKICSASLKVQQLFDQSIFVSGAIQGYGSIWRNRAFGVPFWVVLLCHAAIGLGTFFGGWWIVKTMGHKRTAAMR